MATSWESTVVGRGNWKWYWNWNWSWRGRIRSEAESGGPSWQYLHLRHRKDCVKGGKERRGREHVVEGLDAMRCDKLSSYRLDKDKDKASYAGCTGQVRADLRRCIIR